MRSIFVLLTSFVLGFVGVALSAFADVGAPDPNNGMGFQLYFVSAQGDLMRGDCTQSSTIRNRANCASALTSLPPMLFYDELFQTYGRQAEEFEARVVDDYAKVQDVDRKLLELIAASSDPRRGQEILDQIRVQEQVLSQKVLTEQELREQIVRVREGLAMDPTSQDLQQQYIQLNRDLVTATQNVEMARAELAALNRRYVEGNSSLISEEQFDLLWRQRDALVTDIQTYQAQHQIQLDWRKEVARALKMIQDHTFVYEVPPATGFGPDIYYVIQGFGGAFDRVVQRMKNPYFVRSSSNPMLMTLDQPFDLIVDQISCSFEVWQTECTNPRVQLKAGFGYQATIDGAGFLFFDSVFNQDREAPNFLGKSAKGRWSALLICDEGRPPDVASWGAICGLTLK